MSSVLEYKGYHAKIEFDAKTFSVRGKIEGINDFVDFESSKLENIEAEFHSAVDDYLDFCKEVGKEPDKEYKGSFNVRVFPDLHRRAVLAAEKANISLNQFVQKAMENELGCRRYESITILVPEQVAGRYAPICGEVGNFGEKEEIGSWRNVRFADFVS